VGVRVDLLVDLGQAQKRFFFGPVYTIQNNKLCRSRMFVSGTGWLCRPHRHWIPDTGVRGWRQSFFICKTGFSD